MSCHSAYLLEELVIRRGGIGSAAEPSDPVLQGPVIWVIGHHCPSMEIGRKNEVEGADPLDHSLGLRFHLWRDEGLAVKLQPEVPNGSPNKSVRKRPQKMACPNTTESVLLDMRSVDGEILVFCLMV